MGPLWTGRLPWEPAGVVGLTWSPGRAAAEKFLVAGTQCLGRRGREEGEGGDWHGGLFPA